MREIVCQNAVVQLALHILRGHKRLLAQISVKDYAPVAEQERGAHRCAGFVICFAQIFEIRAQIAHADDHIGLTAVERGEERAELHLRRFAV